MIPAEPLILLVPVSTRHTRRRAWRNLDVKLVISLPWRFSLGNNREPGFQVCPLSCTKLDLHQGLKRDTAIHLKCNHNDVQERMHVATQRA